MTPKPKYSFAQCQEVRQLRAKGMKYEDIQKVVPMPIGYMSLVINGSVRVKK